MRNYAKVFGIIALVAITIFSMAACGGNTATTVVVEQAHVWTLDDFEIWISGRDNNKQFRILHNVTGESTAPGTVRLTSPAVYARIFTPVKFNSLAAGQAVVLDIPFYTVGLLTFEIEFEDGYKFTQTAKYDVAYAEKVRAVAGVNPARNSTLPAFIMDTAEYVRPNTGPMVWNGPQSLSATTNFAWDDNNLYVYCVVIDPEHFNNQTGGDIWNGDSLQLGIDLTRASGANNARNELGFSLSNDGTIRRYRWATPSGLGEQNLSAITVRITRDETAKTTIYDLTIPFTTVHSNAASLDKSRIGVSVFINDAINGARAQELEVEQGHLKDPSLFTTLYLLDSANAYRALIEESAWNAVGKAVTSNAMQDIYNGYNFLRLAQQ
jgi:hypothetical protein